MKCNYVFSRNKSVYYFKRTEQTNDIELSQLDDGLYMIVDCMKSRDVPFIKELVKKCQIDEYFNLSIMDDDLSQDCANALSSISVLYPPVGDNNKIVVTISAALKNNFSNNIFVGTYVYDKGTDIVYSQPINAGQLTYLEFKSVFSVATAIVNEIPQSIRNNRIDSIVWIDNWFQDNIQYIKSQTTIANDAEYICEAIPDTYTAKMPDVFLRHFGVCEDIATSIAVLLHILGIPYKEVQANGHAWLLVSVGNKNYIWDCTHNITRNDKRHSSALKATLYSDKFTLIGERTFPLKYKTLDLPGYNVNNDEYPREELIKSKEKLIEYGLKFSYGSHTIYESYINA